MVDPQYQFCPFDAGKLVVEERHGQKFQVCEVCKRTLYHNQLLTVSALIIRDGKILVAKRAIEPFAGTLDLPGGYVEQFETAREALLRELQEELHVGGKIVQAFEVLGPDPYPFEGVIRQNADMLYQVDIGSEEPRADDDVSDVVWMSLDELKLTDFAFPSHRQFIEKLMKGEYTLH